MENVDRLPRIWFFVKGWGIFPIICRYRPDIPFYFILFRNITKYILVIVIQVIKFGIASLTIVVAIVRGKAFSKTILLPKNDFYGNKKGSFCELPFFVFYV